MRKSSAKEAKTGVMKNRITALIQDERGTSAVEMGLICALIVLAMLTALQGFANETQLTWNTIASSYSGANAGVSAS